MIFVYAQIGPNSTEYRSDSGARQVGSCECIYKSYKEQQKWTVS